MASSVSPEEELMSLLDAVDPEDPACDTALLERVKWQAVARFCQQQWFERLGDRNWDLVPAKFKHRELLVEKIITALNQAGAYQEEELSKQMADKITNLSKEMGADEVCVSVVFIYCYTKSDINILRRVVPATYSTEVVFRVRGEKNIAKFIDTQLRVYDTWVKFKSNNRFPKCECALPRNGRYIGDQNQRVLLDFELSPACSMSSRVAGAVDTGGTALGLGSAVVGLAALALPVAGPVLIGASIVGAATGVCSAVRSAYTLHDRKSHTQSISLADKEARGAWIDIGLNVVTLGMSAHSMYSATSAASNTAKTGEAASKVGQANKAGSEAAKVAAGSSSTVGGTVENVGKLSKRARKAARAAEAAKQAAEAAKQAADATKNVGEVTKIAKGASAAASVADNVGDGVTEVVKLGRRARRTAARAARAAADLADASKSASSVITAVDKAADGVNEVVKLGKRARKTARAAQAAADLAAAAKDASSAASMAGKTADGVTEAVKLGKRARKTAAKAARAAAALAAKEEELKKGTTYGLSTICGTVLGFAGFAAANVRTGTVIVETVISHPLVHTCCNSVLSKVILPFIKNKLGAKHEALLQQIIQLIQQYERNGSLSQYDISNFVQSFNLYLNAVIEDPDDFLNEFFMRFISMIMFLFETSADPEREMDTPTTETSEQEFPSMAASDNESRGTVEYYWIEEMRKCKSMKQTEPPSAPASDPHATELELSDKGEKVVKSSVVKKSDNPSEVDPYLTELLLSDKGQGKILKPSIVKHDRLLDEVFDELEHVIQLLPEDTLQNLQSELRDALEDLEHDEDSDDEEEEEEEEEEESEDEGQEKEIKK